MRGLESLPISQEKFLCLYLTEELYFCFCLSLYGLDIYFIVTAL